MATVVMEDAAGRVVAEVTHADVRHDPETGAFRVSGTPTVGADEPPAPGSAVTVVLEGVDGNTVATLNKATVRHDPQTGAFCVSGESEGESKSHAVFPVAASGDIGTIHNRPTPPVSEDTVSSLLTVVVTTSPARCNPSLEMLEAVVDSFKLVPGLRACRLIVVCDGCNIGKKHRPSRGIVSEDAADRYMKFIDALHAAAAGNDSVEGETGSPLQESPLQGADILVQSGREGFGFAVKKALESVETEFVMIVHHDQRYRKAFDLPGIIRAMRDYPGIINYCGVLSPGTIGYAKKCAGKGLPNPDAATRPLGNATLVPLYVWYDRNHVANVDFYKSNVMGSGLIKKGNFIEDCYGQDQLKRIKTGGLEVWQTYGTWFLDDLSGESIIHHLDGRRFMTDAQRAEQGLPVLSRCN